MIHSPTDPEFLCQEAFYGFPDPGSDWGVLSAGVWNCGVRERPGPGHRSG